MNTIGKRIRVFGTSKYNKINDFAEAMQMKASNLQLYMSDKRKPGSGILKRLETLGCNTSWVLTGKGEMYADTEKESLKPEKATEEDRLTSIENELKQLKKNRLTSPDLTEQVQIPLYQHAVSAGPACTVSDEVEEYIPVSKKIVKHPRETFAVRASGDSMKGVDIHEGDIIICDARGTVKTGSIVVASIDGAQTLKKIVLKQGTVTLEPANHNHTTIAITDNSDLAILGVVIALFRIMP